ncbi:MAG: amidase [Verrucomicrobiota bacterium]|jgi:amidase
MNRRDFLHTTALRLAQMTVGNSAFKVSAPLLASATPFRVKPFAWEEATVPRLQAAMKSAKATAASLVKQYLRRIDDVDRSGPALNSILELNPDALAIARQLDQERKVKGPRGPLHGIPVLIKDNLGTHDRMMTTAGSLALLGSISPRDSFVAQRLREAGAVILGKTNLSEWANFRSTRSTSGWSGRGGLTKNPYALDRNPSGSSSGTASAVAANLCAVGLGTETDGSITLPCSYNGLVGMKPTIGLVSRAGIIPIAHSQDTAGPMTRTVTDAAILLGALTGIDPRDLATEKSSGKGYSDYTQFLEANGLRGARVGVARQFFELQPGAKEIADAMLEVLKRCGAILVDPANIPTNGKFSDSEDLVLQYEFKTDLNAYLAGLGPGAPVQTLQDIIEFNERNRDQEMPFFGQEIFVKAQGKGPLTDQAYLDALEKNHRLSRDEGIDAVMNEHQLDALVSPTTGPAQRTDLIYGDRDTGGCTTPAAVAGYPHITVPAGDVFGLPVGLSFFGRAFSEPMLFKCAFAFEQATKARKTPRFLPTLATGREPGKEDP